MDLIRQLSNSLDSVSHLRAYHLQLATPRLKRTPSHHLGRLLVASWVLLLCWRSPLVRSISSKSSGNKIITKNMIPTRLIPISLHLLASNQCRLQGGSDPCLLVVTKSLTFSKLQATRLSRMTMRCPLPNRDLHTRIALLIRIICYPSRHRPKHTRNLDHSGQTPSRPHSIPNHILKLLTHPIRTLLLLTPRLRRTPTVRLIIPYPRIMSGYWKVQGGEEESCPRQTWTRFRGD